MSSFFSSVLGSVSGSLSGPNSMSFGPARVLSIRTSKQDGNLILIHPANIPPDAPPQFTVTSSPVVMYYGHPSNNHVAGTVTSSTWSSTTQLTVRGQPMSMKKSSTTGHNTIECSMGMFKWKSTSELSGSSISLFDSQGTRLAKLKTVGLGGEKQLEVFVNCDDYLLEIMLVSGVAAKKIAKAETEAAIEVLQAVAGA